MHDENLAVNNDPNRRFCYPAPDIKRPENRNNFTKFKQFLN
jgi:hypothetical protein